MITINKTISIIRWPYNNINISSISSGILNNISSIFKPNISGTGFLSYDPSSLFNSFSSFDTNESYLIVSKPNSIPYVLFSSNNPISPPELYIIRKPLDIITYYGDTINLSDSIIKNNTDIIYGINIAGNGYLSYSSSTLFNTLNQMINDSGYIAYSKNSSIPYVLFKPTNSFEVNYIQSNNDITITLPNHNLTPNSVIRFEAITGLSTSQEYTIDSISSQAEFMLKSNSSNNSSGRAIVIVRSVASTTTTTTTASPTTTTTASPTTTTTASPTTTTTASPTTTTTASPTTTTTASPTTTTTASPTTTTTASPTTTTTASPTTTTTASPTTTTTSQPTTLNSANFAKTAVWNGGPNVTTVGSNGGSSYYGTYDQNGNVWEWTSLEPFEDKGSSLRGGCWGNTLRSQYIPTHIQGTQPNTDTINDALGLKSDEFGNNFWLVHGYTGIAHSVQINKAPSTKSNLFGFRIASINNPYNIDNFVAVGDINNENNTINITNIIDNSISTKEIGRVEYNYLIGKYCVTNYEYALFLNAVATSDPYELYDIGMDSDPRGGIVRVGSSGSYAYNVKPNMGNKPVVYISWFSAARYCNWLHNNKNGDIEDGAYTLEGRIDGNTINKNNDAKYYIPNSNEWYKAAYYKGGSANAGYWKYATQSDTDPVAIACDNITGNGPIVSSYSHPTPTTYTISTTQPPVIFANSANYGGITINRDGLEGVAILRSFDRDNNNSRWIIDCDWEMSGPVVRNSNSSISADSPYRLYGIRAIGTTGPSRRISSPAYYYPMCGLTTVGTNGGPSAYGTYDQTGNISEYVYINSGNNANTYTGISSLDDTTSLSNGPVSNTSNLGIQIGYMACTNTRFDSIINLYSEDDEQYGESSSNAIRMRFTQGTDHTKTKEFSSRIAISSYEHRFFNGGFNWPFHNWIHSDDPIWASATQNLADTETPPSPKSDIWPAALIKTSFRIASRNNLWNISNMVLVADEMNEPDANGLGAVNYSYYIGKYTITNEEYVQFLNAVAIDQDKYKLSPTNYLPNIAKNTEHFQCGIVFKNGQYQCKPNWEKKPVTNIDWYCAARYCNWLHNGMPVGGQNRGTTEDGAYPLYLWSSKSSIPRFNGDFALAPESSYQIPAPKSGALYYIPTAQEWYKAAYYKGGGTSAGYWAYATQSDDLPARITADGVGNGPIAHQHQTTDLSPVIDLLTPTDNRIELLLDSSNISNFIFSSGAAIREWKDKSNKQRIATQTTVNQQPSRIDTNISFLLDSNQQASVAYKCVRFEKTGSSVINDRLTVFLPSIPNGVLILHTLSGIASYNISISAGAYQIGPKNGFYMPETDILDCIIVNDVSLAPIIEAYIKSKYNIDLISTGLTTAPAIVKSILGEKDYRDITNFTNFWRSWSEITGFPKINTSNGTNFQSTWNGCSGLTAFPTLDISKATNISFAWANCTNLSSFPLLSTGLVKNFSYSWSACSSLTSFPTIDTSQGTEFTGSWQNCSGLTSFPSLVFSSGRSFNSAWNGCSQLTTVPTGLFDSCTSTSFINAFRNTNLTQQSIDNILLSINSNGTSSGTFFQSGGSNTPSSSGWLAVWDMIDRDWDMTVINSCGNGVQRNGTTRNVFYVDNAIQTSGWSVCANTWIYRGMPQSGVSSTGNGWSTSSNIYFINGNATSLPDTGSGSWNDNYYINGQITTLNTDGTGGWNNNYYINGTMTTLNSYGNGTWNSEYYVDGNLNPSGWSANETKWIYQGVVQNGVNNDGNGWSTTSNQYFLSGEPTTLNSCGNGSWNGVFYIDGVENTSGWSECAQQFIDHTT